MVITALFVEAMTDALCSCKSKQWFVEALGLAKVLAMRSVCINETYGDSTRSGSCIEMQLKCYLSSMIVIFEIVIFTH